MLTYGINIIENNDLVVGATSNDEAYLALFWFKKQDWEFVGSQELAQELGPNFVAPCTKLTYLADR